MQEIMQRLSIIEKMLFMLLNDEQKEKINKQKLEYYQTQLDETKARVIEGLVH